MIRITRIISRIVRMWFLSWALWHGQQELQLLTPHEAAQILRSKLPKRAQYSVFRKGAPSGEHGMRAQAMRYGTAMHGPAENACTPGIGMRVQIFVSAAARRLAGTAILSVL